MCVKYVCVMRQKGVCSTYGAMVSVHFLIFVIAFMLNGATCIGRFVLMNRLHSALQMCQLHLPNNLGSKAQQKEHILLS